MRKIAHLVNPVIVNQTSDLFVAQPITFETMKRAKEFAQGQVEVALLSAQYPEDRPLVPDGFHLTPDLERSVLDLGRFKKQRKLPLLADILDRLYQATDAEYLIYTNVDIAVMLYFYLTVNALIEQGYDAFVINRRTIEATYDRPADIPLMYAEAGDKHPGFDCFVFKREVYPHYKLGATCLGIPWIDSVLIWNVACHAQNFSVFRKLHVSFHIGDSQTWLEEKYTDYYVYNKEEARKVLQALEQIHGPLEEIRAFTRNALGVEFQKQRLSDDGTAEAQLKRLKKGIERRLRLQRAIEEDRKRNSR